MSIAAPTEQTAPLSSPAERAEGDARTEADVPWVLIVWNDPVNLMSYVSWVFRSYFGYSEARANTLMLEVHQQGRSVVATGSREKIEQDTTAMHGYGLWATYRRADQS
ncbi:ATP-dependent Clp protease adapter ClpS [Tersicoccus phoenicis]|uniref:ATP-dependent Clp protease adapter protein ClpS n=1 Tax=Tersicoccus phoenicis TaxID=554083 RepID=A0A1R1LL22_9MICC|nr:ATP-dependent Clp protease adapter ClpS [Tersicoccus phoenicis]OMH28245.1 ATP-dependent Clp protease adapter ClpS [Tersicoccus phoenicis]